MMPPTQLDRSRALKVKGYVNRPDFIVARCRGKRVLDLGVDGETTQNSKARLGAFPSSLHLRLAEAASYLVGIDHAKAEIDALASMHPALHLRTGDAERLHSALAEEGPFDVAVAGDIIEHLANPGAALRELAAVLEENGMLIVSAPNAFGAPNYLRFLSGRYFEGPDHVQSYNKFTLANLLGRTGFVVSEVWTALDRIPSSLPRRRFYRVASTVLRALPELGGTLVVVARKAQREKRRS
jgi:2-polyprenyl-3-methyl-5-hydroxy-6-metoxy-1,4-benzoquinol methylase